MTTQFIADKMSDEDRAKVEARTAEAVNELHKRLLEVIKDIPKAGTQAFIVMIGGTHGEFELFFAGDSRLAIYAMEECKARQLGANLASEGMSELHDMLMSSLSTHQ